MGGEHMSSAEMGGGGAPKLMALLGAGQACGRAALGFSGTQTKGHPFCFGVRHLQPRVLTVPSGLPQSPAPNEAGSRLPCPPGQRGPGTGLPAGARGAGGALTRFNPLGLWAWLRTLCFLEPVLPTLRRPCSF